MSITPSSISIAQFSAGIYDQGSEGSCTANAIDGDIEFQMNEAHSPIAHLSRQQLYNDTRQAMGTFSYDSGSSVQVAYNVTMNIGIADESSFAYGPINMYVQPSDAVHSEASTQKVLSYTNLNQYQNYSGIAETIKQYLVQGKPVLCATHNLTLSDGTYIGEGHDFFIVGVDDATQTYTFQNSWGSGWGNNGFGTFSYKQFAVGYGQPAALLQIDVLNGFKGHDWTWTDERKQVAELYADLLKRCGENFGIKAWADNVHTGSINMDGLANAFYNSSEGQALYSTETDTQYVGDVYHSATGRVIDQASSDFFVNQLHQGTSRGSLAYNILHWVDIGNDTPIAHDRVVNMTNVSMNYGVTYEVDGTHYNTAVHALQNVTDDATTVQAALIGIRTDLGWQ